jgi:hypothetical protein
MIAGRAERRGAAWQALLSGVWRERALGAVQAIAASLRAGCAAGAAPGATVDASLGGAAAGQALLFAYLAEARREAADQTAARQWLTRALQALSEAEVPASLYAGLTGVGWAAAHLQQLFSDLDVEPIGDEIDEELLEYLARSPWPGTYDLIDGLVGFGVYAVERRPRPAVVDRQILRPSLILQVPCEEVFPCQNSRLHFLAGGRS